MIVCRRPFFVRSIFLQSNLTQKRNIRMQFSSFTFRYIRKIYIKVILKQTFLKFVICKIYTHSPRWHLLQKSYFSNALAPFHKIFLPCVIHAHLDSRKGLVVVASQKSPISKVLSGKNIRIAWTSEEEEKLFPFTRGMFIPGDADK